MRTRTVQRARLPVVLDAQTRVRLSRARQRQGVCLLACCVYVCALLCAQRLDTRVRVLLFVTSKISKLVSCSHAALTRAHAHTLVL